MATKVGCGLNDRCWAVGMRLANSDSDAARSLCENAGANPVGCTAHSFPADFSDALLRGGGSVAVREVAPLHVESPAIPSVPRSAADSAPLSG